MTATIYAAVIEWGDDESPSLILERSDAARLAELRTIIDNEWPEATTSEAFQRAEHDGDSVCWISLYEAEV